MLRSKVAAVAALVLSSAPAFAFRDSSPLLLWSSHPNEAIRETAEAITSGVIGAEQVYATMSSLGCDWDTLVVAHMEDLHQTHVPELTLPRDADLHIPYLIRPTAQLLDAGLNEWALLCGANVAYRLEEAYGNGRTIVRIDVDRSEDIAALPSKIPANHILLLTGTRTPPTASELAKRQETERPFPSHTTTRPGSPTGGGSSNDTNGPLLSRVQLLTTPVITAALVSFGVFIPIVAFGVYSLAGIQVPPRMLEIGKGLVVTKDRKDQ